MSDITYVRTDEGFCYLATVLDLGSRRIVGWSLERRMPDDLVIEAIEGALRMRDSLAGAIFHSDRGSRYLSRKVRQLCTTLGLRQSVGRVATCYDNAVAEAFFGSLKRELVARYRFANLAEAQVAIARWIHRYKTPSGCTRALGTYRPSSTSPAGSERRRPWPELRLSSKSGEAQC